MRRLKVHIAYYVPDGLFCNLDVSKPKTGPLTRCRFCTEVSKGSFVCVLHNEPLLVEAGSRIYKALGCIKEKRYVW